MNELTSSLPLRTSTNIPARSRSRRIRAKTTVAHVHQMQTIPLFDAQLVGQAISDIVLHTVDKGVPGCGDFVGEVIDFAAEPVAEAAFFFGVLGFFTLFLR